MKTTKSLIFFALKSYNCTQKELANRLGVSPSQISKWKKGEYMSQSMKLKIADDLGLSDHHPEFILLAGSVAMAEKWGRLIRFLADYALQVQDSSYATDLDLLESHDEGELLNLLTFQVLTGTGVRFPKNFPAQLDVDYAELTKSDQASLLIENLLSNPYASLIYSLYEAYINVYSFYTAYIRDLLEELDPENSLGEIERDLIALAASKIEIIGPEQNPYITKFKANVHKKYNRLLSEFKTQVIKARFPVPEEPLKLLHLSHDELGHLAEREELGFNEDRLHPDIYMNELLTGMRTIQQALPLILKKLDLEDELKLDHSESKVL